MASTLSILLLDDEPIVGKRLKPALEREGYTVEVFEDGRSALARLGQQRFDIVVTDVRMDDVDGIQVLEAVQAMSRRTKGHPHHRLRHRRAGPGGARQGRLRLHRQAVQTE